MKKSICFTVLVLSIILASSVYSSRYMPACAATTSFNIAQAQKDGYKVYNQDGCTFIDNDSYVSFDTPYSIENYSSIIYSDIVIDTSEAYLRTWIEYVAKKPIGIRSVSFIIGDTEYEFGDVYLDNNVEDHNEYIIETVMIV